MKVILCQVPHCGKPAMFHSFPANQSTPDEGGMQTCDEHLIEGMSHLADQQAPEHWLVYPLHSTRSDTHEQAAASPSAVGEGQVTAPYCEKHGHDWNNVPEGRECITCGKFMSAREIDEEDRTW